VNNIPHFLVTKRLQLSFKKNTAAAAEPDRLLVQEAVIYIVGVRSKRGKSSR
jgi:hypothetical protein